MEDNTRSFYPLLVLHGQRRSAESVLSKESNCEYYTGSLFLSISRSRAHYGEGGAMGNHGLDRSFLFQCSRLPNLIEEEFKEGPWPVLP